MNASQTLPRVVESRVLSEVVAVDDLEQFDNRMAQCQTANETSVLEYPSSSTTRTYSVARSSAFTSLLLSITEVPTVIYFEWRCLRIWIAISATFV